MAMLMAGCGSSPEARPTEPTSKVDAGTTAPSEPAVGETVLHFRGDVEVAISADGRVIWEIGDGDPGYLQRRLTPEGVERLRSRAVSTGLFEQDQGLTLDHRPGGMEVRRGSMEVRRDDRSVIVVWREIRLELRLGGGHERSRSRGSRIFSSAWPMSVKARTTSMIPIPGGR